MAERIAKRLAHAGLASRREAEQLIADGRVEVNGRRLTTPAVTVAAQDRVTLDGVPIPDAPTPCLWRCHKPAGVVVTRRDERGRRTVFDLLPADLSRLLAVGRLDIESEGLLLLTNDGELARWLELPATGWARRYRVRVWGRPTPAMTARLKAGMVMDGIRLGPIEATIDAGGEAAHRGANTWLTVVLREGRNREIRRAMEALGLRVNRLLRTAYGPFQLGALPRGALREVPRRMLKDQLGAPWKERIGAHRRRAP